MRNVLCISLPDKILKDLKNESKKENASVSEVIRKALKDYFYKADFDRARNKVQLAIAEKGIKYSEKDILEKIS